MSEERDELGREIGERTWWDAFAEAGGLDQLETWLGGVDAPSRVRIRERIAECEYDSVVDCGAGLGIDYIGMANLSHKCKYIGVEPSELLRQAAVKQAHNWHLHQIPLVAGTIDRMPLKDRSHDLVYARHVFEHLPKIEGAIREMLRVARLEVIVVFFMRPGKETYLTRERDGLWQNWWSKPEIERLLALNDDRVEVFFWETLGTEVLLHVYVKGSATLDYGRIGQRLVSEEEAAAEVEAEEKVTEPELHPAEWDLSKVSPLEMAALRRAGRVP